MRLKISLFFICFSFCLTCGYAQDIQVRFFNQAGKEVKTRDSAYYIRTIKEFDKNTSLYDVQEDYINGKPKLTGKTSSLNSLKLEGQCITYYTTGIKRQVAFYKDGQIAGEVESYFSNGTLYTRKQYIPRPADIGNSFFSGYLILACNDSTGKELVVNGNGYYVDHELNFLHIEEGGFVKDGLREGQWKGVKNDKDDKIVFTETFKKGRMITGTSVGNDNKTYSYTNREVLPTFNGGMQAFYQFLGQRLKYPQVARQKNIQGRVYISFTVEKNGALTDIKIARAPNIELGMEALRVVKESPDWIPGSFAGQPVSVPYTVPINFTLGATK